MRTLKFLLQKEFRQIFRNKGLLPLLFVMPIMQLLILPLAADYDIKIISLGVVDHDHSPYSQRMISKILASGYFELTGYDNSFKEAYKLVEKDKADLVLEIPLGFERNLILENEQKLFIAVNAINGTKGGLGGAYLGNIIREFDNDIRTEILVPPRMNPSPVIEVTSSNWFNPLMNYNFFMVPGILAILITMIGGFMSALNIVREKEVGTIEQINVTPIKKHHFLLGKLIPFWVIGMIIFTVGLLGIARFVYHIIPIGSIGLLYLFLSVYLLSVLGLGLLISTFADNQQQAMSVAFFVMMIFMLMSGLFTPIDGMPEWAKVISSLSPATYFIQVMRMIVLKGSTFSDIKYHFIIVIAFAIVLNVWAVLNYKKTA